MTPGMARRAPVESSLLDWRMVIGEMQSSKLDSTNALPAS